MKKILLPVLAFVFSGVLNAQDNITKNSGDEIKAQITAAGSSEITLKKNEYRDGVENLKKPVANERKGKALLGGYISKAREVQAKDPGFSLNLGNGWYSGQGIMNPVIAFDIRMPRKNVFLRGIAIGVRASFTGLGDAVLERQNYTEIYGFGINLKYYAPLPIKVIQPYLIAIGGAAMYNHYTGYDYVQFSYGPGWMHNVNSEVLPYGGFGIGCNFMLLRHLGFFVEGGYFTTSRINTGLVIKIGGTKRD